MNVCVFFLESFFFALFCATLFQHSGCFFLLIDLKFPSFCTQFDQFRFDLIHRQHFRSNCKENLICVPYHQANQSDMMINVYWQKWAYEWKCSVLQKKYPMKVIKIITKMCCGIKRMRKKNAKNNQHIAVSLSHKKLTPIWSRQKKTKKKRCLMYFVSSSVFLVKRIIVECGINNNNKSTTNGA